jgi:hypothetical protein
MYVCQVGTKCPVLHGSYSNKAASEPQILNICPRMHSLIRIVPAASRRAFVRNVAQSTHIPGDLDESRGGVGVHKEPAPPEARKDAQKHRRRLCEWQQGALVSREQCNVTIETNRMHVVLFGMQNRTFCPYRHTRRQRLAIGVGGRDPLRMKPTRSPSARIKRYKTTNRSFLCSKPRLPSKRAPVLGSSRDGAPRAALGSVLVDLRFMAKNAVQW